jgi:hypothetical protein
MKLGPRISDAEWRETRACERVRARGLPLSRRPRRRPSTGIVRLAAILMATVLVAAADDQETAEKAKADKAGLLRKDAATSQASGVVLPTPEAAKVRCAPVVVPKLAHSLVLAARVFVLPDLDVAFLCNEDLYKSDAVSETKKVHALISHDGATTWSEYAGDTAAWTYAPCLRDGKLLEVGSYGWENHPDTPENRKRLADLGFYIFDARQGNAPGTISVIHRLWERRSSDGGKTWSPKTEIALPAPMPHLASYGRDIVLRDGTFLAPLWGRFDLKAEPKWVSALVLRSADNGRTWQMVRVASSAAQDMCEHEIAQAANGDVVSVIRTTAQRELWQAISHDGGRTWTDLRFSGLIGSTPALVPVKRGIICIYVRRSLNQTPTCGVYAGLSCDNGRSWQSYLLWDANGAVVDGYPTAVELPDGRVCASFGALREGRLSGWVVSFDPGALP